MEQIRRDKRTCPEETIFQFGKEGIGATPEQLLTIFTAFKQQFEERYGAHVHMLDWAMHCDETTVHIQERHCFDYVNKYGEVEPKQEKGAGAHGHSAAAAGQATRTLQQPQNHLRRDESADAD